MFLKWVKFLFAKKSKNPEKVVIGFVLPDGKKFNIEAIKPSTNPFACKIHPDYIPVSPPTNNCNSCWEYYSKGRSKW
jgi:hypothetical protein